MLIAIVGAGVPGLVFTAALETAGLTTPRPAGPSTQPEEQFV